MNVVPLREHLDEKFETLARGIDARLIRIEDKLELLNPDKYITVRQGVYAATVLLSILTALQFV